MHSVVLEFERQIAGGGKRVMMSWRLYLVKGNSLDLHNIEGFIS